MFHPLAVYMGLRYVRARPGKFFVSFITWASLVGVCVGVAALIVILSVMNGFEAELRERLLSLSAQVTSMDGRERVTGTVTGTTPEATGMELAALLRDRGADAILNQIREPASR